jgi:hypothetical protein
MWKVSAKYPRDIVTEDGKLVCTTYGSDAEENARWIVEKQAEIQAQLKDLTEADVKALGAVAMHMFFPRPLDTSGKCGICGMSKNDPAHFGGDPQPNTESTSPEAT